MDPRVLQAHRRHAQMKLPALRATVARLRLRALSLLPPHHPAPIAPSHYHLDPPPEAHDVPPLSCATRTSSAGARDRTVTRRTPWSVVSAGLAVRRTEGPRLIVFPRQHSCSAHVGVRRNSSFIRISWPPSEQLRDASDQDHRSALAQVTHPRLASVSPVEVAKVQVSRAPCRTHCMGGRANKDIDASLSRVTALRINTVDSICACPPRHTPSISPCDAP
jgi:hypothetical protein